MAANEFSGETDIDRIERWFKRPVTSEQMAQREKIRKLAHDFSMRLVEMCAPGADRTQALRHIRSASDCACQCAVVPRREG